MAYFALTQNCERGLAFSLCSQSVTSHWRVLTARVASELYMSMSQFRRKISAATGLTAANYILMIRMDEAKQLLDQYPKYTMSEIAQRCGFADSAHFTHVFKRLFGITPSDYTKGA